jgi:hypothetical protein
LAQKAISELAKALLIKGSISGYDSILLFEKIWCSRPKKSLPARFHSKNSEIDSLAAAIKSTSQLTKLALDVLRGYRERDVGEERIIDQIATKLVETLLELEQAFSRLRT